MKFKDFLGIALISVFMFPVILLIVALSMDLVHLEFGTGKEAREKANTFLRRYHPKQDESEIEHMNTFKAIEKRSKELDEKQSLLNREAERLENLKNENLKLKDQITRNRKKVEDLVAQSKEIQNRRLSALAEVYGSMRPEEAAPILLTLNDELVATIMRLVPEVRSQSKLMGALGAMDVKRAARISRIMGKPVRKKI